MFRTTSILLVLLGGLIAAPAFAHPRLQASSPVAGAVLKAAPKEIRMNFSEGLIAMFSGLELKDGSGKSIPTGKAVLVPGDLKRLVVPIVARLAPGSYTVAWHAVSVDTHRVTGSFGFKVVK